MRLPKPFALSWAYQDVNKQQLADSFPPQIYHSDVHLN